MNKLLIFIGMTAGSYAGWALGENFGIMTAFVISTIGSIIGIFAGWYINKEYLE